MSARVAGEAFAPAYSLSSGSYLGAPLVNWLTLIEDSFVLRLGGEKIVRKRLGDAIEVHRMPWGLMRRFG